MVDILRNQRNHHFVHMVEVDVGSDMVRDEIKVFFSKDLGTNLHVERLMPVQYSSHALFVFALDNITREYKDDYYEMPDARSYKDVSKHPKFTLKMDTKEFVRYLIFSNKMYLENVCVIIARFSFHV